MTATLDEIINEAWNVLQDTDATSRRYSQSRLLDAYNFALREAYRLRPDLFIGAFNAAISVTPNTTVDLTAVTFPLPESLMLPFANFVAGRAELADDEFSVDGRAMGLMTSFASALMGAS